MDDYSNEKVNVPSPNDKDKVLVDTSIYAILSSIQKVSETSQDKVYSVDVLMTEGLRAGETRSDYIKFYDFGYVSFSYENKDWRPIEFSKNDWWGKLAKLVGNKVGYDDFFRN